MDCPDCGLHILDCDCDLNTYLDETVTGFLGATAHDFDDHSRCDPRSCPNTEQED